MKTFTTTLNASVSAEYAVSASDPTITVSQESVRPGVVRWTVTGVAAGNTRITLAARHEDYRRATATVSVTIALARTIRGTVSDLFGQHGISGAEITLTSLDRSEPTNVVKVVKTHWTGTYRFEGLLGDSYRLEVFHPAWESDSREVRWPQGFGPDSPSMTLDFALSKKRVLTDGRFDRRFWEALVFDAHDCRSATSCDYQEDDVEERLLYVLPYVSPNFHIRTRNLRPTYIARIRDTIPRAVSQLTGQPFTGQITEGRDEVDEDGWVTIHTTTEAEDPMWRERATETVPCGSAWVGRPNGAIYLNADRVRLSPARGKCGLVSTIMHEIGHAMGFFHVSGRNDVMAMSTDIAPFTLRERYHAQLAYRLPRWTRYTHGPFAAQLTENRERTQPQDFPGRSEPKQIFCDGRAH